MSCPRPAPISLGNEVVAKGLDAGVVVVDLVVAIEVHLNVTDDVRLRVVVPVRPDEEDKVRPGVGDPGA